MKIKVSCIRLDQSIQCRAQVDVETVGDYAERMQAGVQFPPVELFGLEDECWIGDGWHRVMAAQQLGLDEIDAMLTPGDRTDALKYALKANSTNGLKRTNADKRRAVEIALREWPGLSSRAIAEMCGVVHPFVEHIRPGEVETVTTSTRTGLDGRQYPAHRQPRQRTSSGAGNAEQVAGGAVKDDISAHRKPVLGPPCEGMRFARTAIMSLEQITHDDVERDVAYAHVIDWIRDHETNETAA